MPGLRRRAPLQGAPTTRKRLLHKTTRARLRVRVHLRNLRVLPDRHRVPPQPASPTRRRRQQGTSPPRSTVRPATQQPQRQRSIMNPLTPITRIMPNCGRPGNCLTRRRFTRSCQVKESPAPWVAGAGHWAHFVQPDAGAAVVNISTLATWWSLAQLIQRSPSVGPRLHCQEASPPKRWRTSDSR